MQPAPGAGEAPELPGLPNGNGGLAAGPWSLTRRYGNERVSAACRRALACGAVSYTSVKSILAENLDRLPLPAPSPTPPPPAHENLRGGDYWQEA